MPPERPSTTCSPGRTISFRTPATRTAMPAEAALRFGFLELAILDELLEACFEQLAHRSVLQLPPAILEGFLQILDRRFVVAVRPAGRLVHDLVDETQRFEPRRCNAERLRRFGRVVRAFPEYGGAA